MGLIEWLFGKALVNSLKNDPKFMSAAEDLDKRLAVRKQILDYKEGDPIPDEVWKIMSRGSKDDKSSTEEVLPQCTGRTKDGSRCLNRTENPSGKCHLHN